LRVEDSKTETGERSIAIPPTLAEEFWQHRRSTSFSGDDERVFCHPKTGGPLDPADFRDALNAAFSRAGLEKPAGFRPFHDLRVTAITNDALAGANPIAINDEGRSREHGDDQGLLEAGRRRIPGRSRATRASTARTFYPTFYPPGIT
jgi:integrase